MSTALPYISQCDATHGPEAHIKASAPPQFAPHIGRELQPIGHLLHAIGGHIALTCPLMDCGLCDAQHGSELAERQIAVRDEKSQESLLSQEAGRGVHAVQNSYTMRSRQAPLPDVVGYGTKMPPSLRAAAAQGLSRLRAHREFSLAQVAERMGVTKAAVHQLERGQTGETLDRIDGFVNACKGIARLVIYEQQEAVRAELLDMAEGLELGTLEPLIRILRVWPLLSPAERDLLALTAEVRTGQGVVAQVDPLRQAR